MEFKEIVCAVEAILFAAGYPIEREKLMTQFELDNVTFEAVEDALKEKFGTDSGIIFVKLGDKLQLCTNEKCLDSVRTALGIRRGGNLSRTSLEVLAIIAYNEPVTRSYIEQVRGVDSSYTVASLNEKGLIEVCGKLEAPGRPSLYRTTPDFLRVFGLTSIHDLPPFEVFDENGQVTVKPL